MSIHPIQLLALSAAFWTALLGYRRRQENPERDVRFVLALGLGALLAHLGWALLYVGEVRERPWAWLDPTTGYCLLFVPLGVLLLSPAQPAHRRAFLASALGSLPLAFAVARIGCLATGCCYGVATSLPWGVPGTEGSMALHPTPLYEIAAWIALHFLLHRVREDWRPSLVLLGLGAVRLLIEPWRAAPPLGEPLVPIELVAVFWLGIGLGLVPARLTRLPESRLRGRGVLLGSTRAVRLRQCLPGLRRLLPGRHRRLP